jgi:DNA replication protein DnaD
MQGWIKLHRKLLAWEWFKDPNMVQLFIFLLLSANHEPNKWQGITVQRGQIITGLKSLSESTGLSAQTLRTCLSRLEKCRILTSQSTNRFRLITICKYSTYQSLEIDTNKPANKQATSKKQAKNNPLTPNKNEKNEKNVKKKKKLPVFPSNLSTPEFLNVWLQWEIHRTEIKKTLTPSTTAKQLKMLSKYPVSIAIATIEKSICSGWQGLFPDKEQKNGNGQTGSSQQSNQGQAGGGRQGDSGNGSGKRPRQTYLR